MTKNALDDKNAVDDKRRPALTGQYFGHFYLSHFEIIKVKI
jgi:hypothetical protein